ncbi:MAG: DUF262 domain-containing protein [Clostridiales bacterium]|nr:DUF262 domain-containing protein [Clostridiales bacterium]
MEELNTSNRNLRSLSINELIVGENGKKYCFLIPSYQRGYRWESKQIETLLDDLWEFHASKKDATVGEFYCLQPIIVKQLAEQEIKKRLGDSYKYKSDENYYEVVDGQQRLTTIYIILRSFYERNPQYFDIEFERDAENNYARKHCLETLGSTNASEAFQIADAQYFVEAYNIVTKWLTDKVKKDSAAESQMQTTVKQETKIIWYELPSDQNIDCYLVFRNINNGKIPLTDAELVKAMLLNSRICSPDTDEKFRPNNTSIKREQERYARLWDEIQHALENDQLWAFITGNHFSRVSPRMDFLIKVAVTQGDKDYNQEGELKLFSYYESKLKGQTLDGKKKYLKSVFDDLRKIYRTIQDWYASYEAYNYIGFIMTYKGKNATERLQLLSSLIGHYQNKTRSEFVQYLIETIKKDILGTKITLSNLSTLNYEDDRKVIEQLLMLFNITELNQIGGKFNFYVKHGWSVEHIKAQHSKFAASEDILDFLKKERLRISEAMKTISDKKVKQNYQSIIQAIDDLMNTQIKEEDFLRLATRIDEEVDGFDEIDMHRMGNLALLSSDDNSSLGNSPFYEKREKLLPILDDPSRGIPYSTKRVFLKMYSPQKFTLDFTKWDKNDFEVYHKKQCEMLKTFLEG